MWPRSLGLPAVLQSCATNPVPTSFAAMPTVSPGFARHVQRFVPSPYCPPMRVLPAMPPSLTTLYLKTLSPGSVLAVPAMPPTLQCLRCSADARHCRTRVPLRLSCYAQLVCLRLRHCTCRGPRSQANKRRILLHFFFRTKGYNTQKLPRVRHTGWIWPHAQVVTHMEIASALHFVSIHRRKR